jgi:hypothetical protein
MGGFRSRCGRGHPIPWQDHPRMSGGPPEGCRWTGASSRGSFLAPLDKQGGISRLVEYSFCRSPASNKSRIFRLSGPLAQIFQNLSRSSSIDAPILSIPWLNSPSVIRLIMTISNQPSRHRVRTRVDLCSSLCQRPRQEEILGIHL